MNMSPIGLNSLETRMKVSSPNYYNFKKPSILAQTIRSSYNSAHFEYVFLKTLTAVWSIKVFLMPWYTYPVFKKYILTFWYNPNKLCLSLGSWSTTLMSFVIAAKFRMIFLGSKVSGHQNLLPFGLRQQHALVTLPTLFSVTELLSPETKFIGSSIFCSGPPNFKIFRGPLGPGPVGPWINASLGP